LDYPPRAETGTGADAPMVSVRGWNVEEKFYPVGR
jgi:hypothetical protein